MGHYTGIAINVKLRKDITPEQVALIRRMTGSYEDEGNLPPPDRDHAIFKNERWQVTLCCQSAYLEECEAMQPKVEERFKQLFDGRWLLRAAASTKSYSLMATDFIDWLAPLVDPSEYGRICGEYRYEYTTPTMFGFSEEGVFRRQAPGPRPLRRRTRPVR